MNIDPGKRGSERGRRGKTDAAIGHRNQPASRGKRVISEASWLALATRLGADAVIPSAASDLEPAHGKADPGDLYGDFA